MEINEILYIVLIVATVVITVTIVWLANEAIGLIKSLKKSADDTAVITKEFKEKVLFVSEALDRVGTAATSVIGMIEDAVEAIKDKRDSIADGLSLVSGVAKMVKGRKRDEGDATESRIGSRELNEGKEKKKPDPEPEAEPEEEEKIEVKGVEKKAEKVEVKTEEDGENGDAPAGTQELRTENKEKTGKKPEDKKEEGKQEKEEGEKKPEGKKEESEEESKDEEEGKKSDSEEVKGI